MNGKETNTVMLFHIQFNSMFTQTTHEVDHHPLPGSSAQDFYTKATILYM